ncbi:hypothetical protein DVH24_016247 [Malus domestica]|uniref:NADH dehydrogenase [ubiquinone] 1 beta subcomplex subunit 3-B n=1 Tax=Malus domestica TaxID=3750 RepID=A0A498HV85_MALDO|nr:hypothetical protein DVH24_016247 [Malus domestica]
MGGSKKALGTTGEFFRRRDEWRKHPMLSNQLRHATPGLGIALVAFGVYLVGEQTIGHIENKEKHSSNAHPPEWHHKLAHKVPMAAAVLPSAPTPAINWSIGTI